MGKKPGRKRRLDVLRKPSGQIYYPKAETEADIKSVVRLQRYRSKLEGIERWKEPQTMASLNHQYMLGHINEWELEAGNLYGGLARRYASLKGIPLKPDCSVSLIMDVKPDTFKDIEMAYLSATESLKACGRSAVTEVATVCLYGEASETLYDLKRGLGTLVDHWGLKTGQPGESEFARKASKWLRS